MESQVVTPKMALEIGFHEAIIRQAYKDSGGTWTWSVGITSNSGHNIERYIDKPQSLEYCLAIWVWVLNRFAGEVLEAFAGHVLTEEQFGGALSFHWNTGAIGKASWVKLWKAGKIAEARKSFLSWDKPAAIKGRRTKEAALFFDGVWANDGRMTEYTKLTSHHTPDWSSGVRVDIIEAIKKALGAEVKDMPGGGEVISTPVPTKPVRNWLVAILSILGAIAFGVAKQFGWIH